MTIDNPNKEIRPKTFFYSISEMKQTITTIGDDISGGIISNNYWLSTNNIIPKEKYEEIEKAIHLILSQ